MLINIQALRALAAVRVIIVHLEVIGAAAGYSKAELGAVGSGVDLLLIISGFIMVYTTMHRDTTPLQFLTNRLLRIVPLYWTMTLAVFAAAIVAPSFMGATAANPIHLLKSMCFVPYVRSDGLPRPTLFVGWTLNLEIFFYAIFALAMLLRRTTHRVLAATSAIVVMVAIGRIFAGRLPFEMSFFSQPMLLEFGVGMLLALAYSAMPASRQIGWAAVSCMPVLLAGVMMCVPISSAWPIAGVPATLLVIAALLAEKAKLQLNLKAILLLGNASYSIYLTHPFLCQGIGRGAAKLGMLTPATAWPLAITAWLLAICSGLAVYYILEKPLAKLVAPLRIRTKPKATLPMYPNPAPRAAA